MLCSTPFCFLSNPCPLLAYYWMHICIWLDTYITKYRLLTCYSTTCMYAVRSDHLTLENQWVCSYLRKTLSLTLNTPYLTVVLRVWLKPHGFSPVHFSMSILVVHFWLVFRQSCWWAYIGVTYITKKHKVFQYKENSNPKIVQWTYTTPETFCTN